MRRLLSSLALALLLFGCGTFEPVGPPFEEDNTIADISFREAYDVKKVKRSPRRIPEEWYILLCDVKDKSDCFTRSITHAPWRWQVVGAKITVVWQRYDNAPMRVVRYLDTATKEKLPW